MYVFVFKTPIFLQKLIFIFVNRFKEKLIWRSFDKTRFFHKLFLQQIRLN